MSPRTVAAPFAALADLVLPRSCIACRSPGAVLCARCRPIDAPIRVGSGDPPIFAATAYDGPVRTALLAYKERGRRDLVGALGELLAGAIAALSPIAGTVLVPVLSAPSAARERGGDHLLRLARRASRTSGLPVDSALRLARAVRDSAGLDTAQRAANLQFAMRARPAPAGRSALVVDDITTTGTTMREACRALESAGWPVHGAAVVAATPRRDRV